MVMNAQNKSSQNKSNKWAKLLHQFRPTRAHVLRQNADKISRAVAMAEQQHQGEICVVVERRLPLAYLLLDDAFAKRAYHLFCVEGVWDTPQNTGVLIYVNLAHHRLMILGDRGIHGVVGNHWQKIVDDALNHCKKDVVGGLLFAIDKIGMALRQYDKLYEHENDNALDNAIRFR